VTSADVFVLRFHLRRCVVLLDKLGIRHARMINVVMSGKHTGKLRQSDVIP
jgi:hypothetical protein